ncbi:MAG: DUF951 domain-containing protein [Dehalococcoidia bacterium]|nr:DUF951 domain-containing protein [Dehalococcoidia bacterium]
MVRPGDLVTLRKPHPCGSREWEVTRIGADIGLKCTGCGRAILLPRHEFRARVQHVTHRSSG